MNAQISKLKRILVSIGITLFFSLIVAVFQSEFHSDWSKFLFYIITLTITILIIQDSWRKFVIINRIVPLVITIIGTMLGGMVNGAIIKLGGKLIPLPKGIDNSTMEALAKTIHLYRPINYLPVFLAHAMGTFVAALLITFLIKDVKTRRRGSYIGAGLYFIGGTFMVISIPAPLWFEITDLVLAYFPMAFLGIQLAEKLKKN